jgi:hypothetical protein
MYPQQNAAAGVLVCKYGNAGICCRITVRMLDFPSPETAESGDSNSRETADFGGRFCFVETV